ncbi:MAG: hypothetical protein IPL98_06225 [Saprospiraceae bacterium]|nr:hypothetical protein [Saprospiraceae bacterium]
MKKNILFYFMLCHVSLLLAGVRIKQFQHPNTFPYNGFIIVEANDPQKPYTIVIKGISTGYTSTVRDVSTEYKFSPLGPDLYEIEVFGSTGCGVVKLSQLLSPCDRLKITPVIKENCFVRKSGKNSPFVETKGSITLNITGGRQPFTFEWRDNNNLNRIISTSKDLLNLSKGTFTVLVKDLDGCMFSQTFTLNGFFMSTKNISRIDQCYTKSEFTIEMDPISIKQYNWSDGTVGRKIVGRHVFNNEITQGHSVTITEPTSQCQIIEALYGPKGTWYWEIKGFKNPSSIGVKDGWVDLVENLTGYSGFIPDPQKIVIMRNGVFYRENVYSTNSSRVYRVNSLEEGDYLFYWKDKEGCDIAAQSIVLYACNGGLHNPSIEITSYALPPSSPNSYVEAIASYQYGSINECKYNWYSSFYNVTTTLVPRLTNAELKKFYSSTTGDLCVKMICPCGEATSCVKFNPCHPDAKFVYTKKDIGSICVGTLPSGKYIETNPKASINIEIDATRYMDIGPLGLPQFNKRIANISWEDGTAVNASYNNNANLLTITRETDKAGEFKLILVTGTGCTIFETYKIENAFEITYSSNATCSFWVKCKGEPGEGTRYLEGRLANINFQSCTVDLMCGDNLIQTAYGFTSKNEYLSTGSTSCIARK